jgi:hypothetical protein
MLKACTELAKHKEPAEIRQALTKTLEKGEKDDSKAEIVFCEG